VHYPQAECEIFGTTIEFITVRRIASIRSQSASRITWHSHDCFELLLLTDGATTYEFRDSRHVDLSGSHFLIIPPGKEHRGVNDVRRPVSLTGIMLDFTKLDQIVHSPFSPSEMEWIITQLEADSNDSHKMSKELSFLVKALPQKMVEVNHNRVESIASLRLRICEILLEIAKQISQQRTEINRATVDRAIEYMRKNLATSCSMEHLAKHALCSRARLFESFRASTGMTPNDYWQRMRVDIAQELLLKTKRSITEIASECGFNTSQYFSSVFRKYSGESPRDFRRKIVGDEA
jgi:AraC-like DNA-binding protein